MGLHNPEDALLMAGNVWYVGKTIFGVNTFQTIQAAINAAAPPSTIYIYPGTYNEQLTLKDGVDLVGISGNVTIQFVSDAAGATVTDGANPVVCCLEALTIIRQNIAGAPANAFGFWIQQAASVIRCRSVQCISNYAAGVENNGTVYGAYGETTVAQHGFGNNVGAFAYNCEGIASGLGVASGYAFLNRGHAEDCRGETSGVVSVFMNYGLGVAIRCIGIAHGAAWGIENSSEAANATLAIDCIGINDSGGAFVGFSLQDLSPAGAQSRAVRCTGLALGGGGFGMGGGGAIRNALAEDCTGICLQAGGVGTGFGMNGGVAVGCKGYGFSGAGFVIGGPGTAIDCTGVSGALGFQGSVGIGMDGSTGNRAINCSGFAYGISPWVVYGIQVQGPDAVLEECNGHAFGYAQCGLLLEAPALVIGGTFAAEGVGGSSSHGVRINTAYGAGVGPKLVGIRTYCGGAAGPGSNSIYAPNALTHCDYVALAARGGAGVHANIVQDAVAVESAQGNIQI